MKRWSLLVGVLALISTVSGGCSDKDEPGKVGGGSDGAVTPPRDGAASDADAAVSTDAGSGSSTPEVSRDLPPYERAPAPPPITGHTWTHKEMGGMVPAGATAFEA